MLTQDDLTRVKLFNPYYAEQYERVVDKSINFVHYTSADVALKILENKQIWLRNSRTMNDFSEIHHGLDCLTQAYNSPIGARLKDALNRAVPGVLDEVAELFFGWSPQFEKVTYLTCFSEHNEATENQTGRLSMWRAYGGDTSVALVVKNTPFLAPTDVLNAFSSPVLYADPDEFAVHFDKFVSGIEQFGSMIAANYDKQEIKNHLFYVFLAASVCTKHPGFWEEKEWRVLCVEEVFPTPNLDKQVEMIRGTPQFVYKLPLKDIDGDDGEVGFQGAAIPDLLERVIIGPRAEGGEVIREAVVHLLEEAGVSNAKQRVFVSGIPLR